MIATIQTHGELLHWHPHIHTLLTCGSFTAEGQFLEVPELDLERLLEAWREAVFALYLAEEKIAPEVVENMRSWPHSGFSVDQSVYLPAGDRAGIERLIGYMTRCPFSLSRLVKVTEAGQVVYKAEKDACRAFPQADGDGLRPGPRRNFQVLDPLEFLAEFTQHIPPKGAHLIRYYGWYSNKARGMRKKAAEGDCPLADAVPTTGNSNRTWAMLIKRVFEVDPLACPLCGGEMKVVEFIEPPQGDVIEKILRHCGLWFASTPRPPPDTQDLVYEPDDVWAGDCPDFCLGKNETVPLVGHYAPDDVWDDSDANRGSHASERESGELTFVAEDTFWATF